MRALGAEGGGSAALKFTITGKTAAGSPFSVVRSDHYADPDYISYSAADDLYGLIYELVSQPFKDITITGVDISGTVDESINQYRVTGVKMPKNGKWVPQKARSPPSPAGPCTGRSR